MHVHVVHVFNAYVMLSCTGYGIDVKSRSNHCSECQVKNINAVLMSSEERCSNHCSECQVKNINCSTNQLELKIDHQ